MQIGKPRVLPDTPDMRIDDMNETAKAHFRFLVKHPFSVIKRPLPIQKTQLRTILKIGFKVMLLRAISKLLIARHELLSRA